MKFGLVANLNRPGAREAIAAFIDWAKSRRHELVFSADLHQSVGDGHVFVERDDIAARVDVLVAMGGDGTILTTVRAVGAAGTPILGINLGSLGFLTQQTPLQLVRALDAIAAGNYSIEERMLLKAEVRGREPLPYPYALNEVVLFNGPVSRVLHIGLKINGEEVVSYIADGLIIATPTGSTAYNLAVGGPIVHPRMEAMIAAPISPFSLTTRPMIIPGEDALEIWVETKNRQAILTLDGQIHTELDDGEPVLITRAEFRSRLVVFPENSYYKLLKGKLHWGVPPHPGE